MDKFHPKLRSHIMRQVKSLGCRSTEERFKCFLQGVRLPRWTSNVASLPGRPDFVFWKSKTIIFIDGCFWHGCSRCSKKPIANARYWTEKIRRNRRRDIKNTRVLRNRGWSVYRIWECRLARWKSLPPGLRSRIART